LGTYAGGHAGPESGPEPKILAGIYLARGMLSSSLLLISLPMSPMSVYVFAALMGFAVAVDGSGHQRHRGADFWRGAFVHAQWLCVFQPPDSAAFWACGWAVGLYDRTGSYGAGVVPDHLPS
jgi:hypothetical protein